MNEREVNMSKLKTKRKKHYLAAAMLAMLAIATPITLYGSVTTYAQTDDAAGAESGEDRLVNHWWRKKIATEIYGGSMQLQKIQQIRKLRQTQQMQWIQKIHQ